MTTTALSKFKPLTYTQHKLLDKAATALRKIRVVYPGLKLDTRSGGIEVLPESLGIMMLASNIKPKPGFPWWMANRAQAISTQLLNGDLIDVIA